MVWHRSITKNLFDFMTQAREMTKSEANSPDQQTSDDVTLEDCLREFKQEETLDDDNMWYCNKC